MSEVQPKSILSEEAAMKLRAASLRPTRQRIAIAERLLDGRARHVSAEQLRDELVAYGQPMALATIYNCLHQFEEAGLLRPVHHAGDAVLYDTNLGDHHHFVDVETGELIDIDPGEILMPELPELPDGFEAESIELTVRLRRKS
ncbi:MAG: transcriptional repressor [Alphaproteobacteria bacterium]|nr:transcriptional repressor [Alphaproteobacteria bacterium]MBL6776650.1 transcriptional repressor [Alphaproteobacteria bacterium]